MNAPWLDWLAVGAVVAGAALWLFWRARRNLRKQKDAAAHSCACLTGCDGCPFAKGCDGKGK